MKTQTFQQLKHLNLNVDFMTLWVPWCATLLTRPAVLPILIFQTIRKLKLVLSQLLIRVRYAVLCCAVVWAHPHVYFTYFIYLTVQTDKNYTPWFDLFREELLHGMRTSDHESFDHPIGCTFLNNTCLLALLESLLCANCEFEHVVFTHTIYYLCLVVFCYYL